MDAETERKRSYRRLICLLALFAIVPLIRPGDAPWINDEPQLISAALTCNESGGIARHGLVGSRGIVYGPVPVWIYSTFLRVTHDLIDLVRLRALLVTLLTAISIYWIARLSPGLRPAVGSVALLSPYLWIYSRQLWDNSFLIPLSALSVAAYLSFCARPAAWKLWVAGLGMAMMCLTHLMSVAFVGPVLAHALWLNRSSLRAYAGTVLSIAAVAGILAWPYVTFLRATGTLDLPVPVFSPWKGWLFPFLGGEFFSFYGVEYFFGDAWFSSGVRGIPDGAVLMLGVLTWAALPFVWFGMVSAARAVRDGFNTSGGARDVDFHMSVIAGMAVVAQILLNGGMRAYGHPHYFNATWIFYFYFFWRTLGSQWVGHVTRPVYTAAMALVLGFLIVNLHRTGGNRDLRYGTALHHQIAIAGRINEFHPDSPVYAEIRNYALFPHAFATLRRVYGWKGTDTGPMRDVTIRYAKDDRTEGWLAVDAAPTIVIPAKAGIQNGP